MSIPALQALLDRSTESASPAVADSVAYPDRQMAASELLEFWKSARLMAMTTVGANGQPHTAPVHSTLDGATLTLVIYDNTVRRTDIRTNPRVSFTTWKDGAVAILYGRAREVAGSLRETRPGRSGAARNVVTIEVALTRAYAMRAPEAATDEKLTDPMTSDRELDRRTSWVPFLVRLAVGLIIATPFIAIILQAIGKR